MRQHNPPSCTYILPHKNRACRLPARRGSVYCGAHLPSTTPCPHCGTTLSADALQRHVRETAPLCPALKRQADTEQQPWYSAFCNGSLSRIAPQPALGDVTQVMQTVSHIVHAQLDLSIPKHVPHRANWHALPEAAQVHAQWADASDSSVKLEPKHFEQSQVLAAALLYTPPTAKCTLLELGAGRAYTAMYVAHVLMLRNVPTDVIVVDRACTRNKADRTLRFWTQQQSSLHTFRRLTCDVTHLYLRGVQQVYDSNDLRVVGKHVCGAALDVSIRAVNNFVCAQPAWHGTVHMVFASCCRRLCSWEALHDTRDVWLAWGIGKHRFEQICRMASWGLDTAHSPDKAQVGRMCRLLIDMARVIWLRKCGWRAHVGSYTDASPEDACIVATWPSAQNPPQ